MRGIDAFKEKNTLGTSLDLVVSGKEIVITRRGKPLAKLVSAEAGADRTKAIAAAHRITTLRKGIKLGDGLTIRQLIDEGRR